MSWYSRTGENVQSELNSRYDERYDGPRASRRSRGYGSGVGRRGLVKSGTVGRLLSTLVLACIFFGIVSFLVNSLI